MYYVTVTGRDFNLAIFVRAGAPGGQSAAFSTRLETCRGAIETIDCDITIDFEWSTAGAGSGTDQVTIFSGSSGASTIPAPGNALTSIAITNITDNCTRYNSIYGCPGPTTTTTTTTTTSTTTTTTTTTIQSYPAPNKKFDQYSSSYITPSPGIPNWPDIIDPNNFDPFIDVLYYQGTYVTPRGSGVSSFLELTGSLQFFETAPEPDLYYIQPPLQSNFFYLGPIPNSFSYSVVFKLDNPFSYSYIFQQSSVVYGGSTFSTESDILYVTANFGVLSSFDNTGPYVRPYISKSGIGFFGPIIRISNTSKWYNLVFTYNGSADSNNAAKAYLNNILTNFNGSSAIPSPSTFFQDIRFGNGDLGTTITPINVAAFSIWSGTALNQGQVQNLFNEYNSRYTLG